MLPSPSPNLKKDDVSLDVKKEEVSSEVKGGEVKSEAKGREVSSEVKGGAVNSEVTETTDGSEVKRGEMMKMRGVVRLRPYNRRELECSPTNIVQMMGDRVIVTPPEEEKIHQFKVDATHWSHDGFTVSEEGVASPETPTSRFSGQEAIFQDVGVKCLEGAWQGLNSAVIAYGTTGTGKSYTMLGTSSDPGLVYRFNRRLFSEIEQRPQSKYRVTLSLLEVYNEKVVDLLSKSTSSLLIRRNEAGTFVKDLTVMQVKSAGQMEEVLLQGLKSRMIAATKMNSSSSRSHLVVTFRFFQFLTEGNGSRVKRRSQIRFVDLAGSEQASKTGATGHRLMEGQSINKSIFSIKSILSYLVKQAEGKKVFVPYQNSKLTYLLKEELGGNCHTTFIGQISPTAFDFHQTLTTLRIICSVGQVTSQVVANELNVDTAVKSWKAVIAEKEAELASATTEEAKKELVAIIEKRKMGIRQLEAPWIELESKEKSVTWWSTSIQLQQKELETTPYLQNISEDTLLSGVTKHIIPEGHILAGNSVPEKSGIQLSGLGIQPEHAIFGNSGSVLTIAPCSNRASVHVNGRPVHTPTELKHMDHIKLGACELFVVVGFPKKRSEGNASNAKNSFEKCLTELAEHHPLSNKLKPLSISNVRRQTAALLLFQEFTDLLPQVMQAQALAAVFDKDTEFEVEAQPDEKMAFKLFIKVTDKDHDKVHVWTKWKFEDRKLFMDQLYDRFLSTGELPSMKERDLAFLTSENQDICLGRGRLSLHTIAYSRPVDDDVSVIDVRGRTVARLHVTIALSASQAACEPHTAPIFRDPKELLGKPLSLQCTVPSFSGVQWVAANSLRGVYCKLWTQREKEVLATETVWGAVSGKFKDTFDFSFEEVTPAELTFFQTRCLMMELWGTQPSSSPSSQPQPDRPAQDSVSSVQPAPQSVTQESDDSKSTSVGGKGLMLDLELAQHLRQFFRNVCPVQKKLQSVKKQATENGQSAEVPVHAWAECGTQLQGVEADLNQCVVTLKDSVRRAILRAKPPS